jgi:hypothetical protein
MEPIVRAAAIIGAALFSSTVLYLVARPKSDYDKCIDATMAGYEEMRVALDKTERHAIAARICSRLGR